jgi:hypothetical protein
MLCFGHVSIARAAAAKIGESRKCGPACHVVERSTTEAIRHASFQARAINIRRESSCVFRYVRCQSVRTVDSEQPSFSAISLSSAPRAAASSTARSRGLSVEKLFATAATSHASASPWTVDTPFPLNSVRPSGGCTDANSDLRRLANRRTCARAYRQCGAAAVSFTWRRWFRRTRVAPRHAPTQRKHGRRWLWTT